MITAIAVLTVGVAQQLRLLNSAVADNSAWTLSQAEVELLALANEVERNRYAVTTAADLDRLRQRFDIFYSRINTFEASQSYAPLRDDPQFLDGLQTVRQFLTGLLTVVDADDDALRAALPVLSQSLEVIRPAVRDMTIRGLSYFVVNADERRRQIAMTLIQLAVAVFSLLALVAVTAFSLYRASRQSARRRRESAATAARMNTIIDTSLDGVIVTDRDGVILEFNKAAEAVFGYSAAEVKGRPVGDVIVPAHLLAAHDAGMARMHKGGEKKMVGKGRVRQEGRRKDGTVFPLELAIQIAETDEGEVFVAFLRDISLRVRAETDLLAARDKALAGERAKTAFLATMSHEIRNPLNGLLGNLSLIRDTKLTGRQEKYIRSMETSGKLLMRHVSDVLDITRYDAGKRVVRQAPVNVDVLLADIIDSLSGMAVSSRTALTWGWDGPAQRWIRTDPELLQHILLNLVGNALKFTRDGSVHVTVSQTDDGQLHFAVTDTGIGMDPSLQERVFDDFVTGNRNYDREVSGTGLGLGISKRFATALGGTIGASSTQGEGSTFWLEIPLHPESPSDAVPAQDNAAPVPPKQVLIVEDNEINRVVVREMLRADGHHTAEAQDGRAGVALAAKTRFDIIFMDISMPVMDGRAATRAIRDGGGASAKTPVIALTANALPEEQAQFLADGMNAVLTKPLARADLQRVMRDHGSGQVPAASHHDEMQQALGADAYALLRDRFLAEAGDFVTGFAAGQTGDAAGLRVQSHKIAGSAAVFGATDLRAVLLQIEAAAKTGAVDDALLHAQDLQDAWRKTTKRLGLPQ